MIDNTFVKAIQDGAKTETVTIGGKEFATKQVFNPPLPDEPLTPTLAVSTLTGLVDFCRGWVAAPMSLVHVRNYQEVALLSPIIGVKRQRENLITANCGAPAFKFNTFMSHAEFMIAIQSQFIDYGDRAKVMKAVGSIRDETVKTSTDDGTTQQVTARAGIALQQEVSLPNPVMLRPFRTFTEIDQPPSQFVLRVQSGKGGLPDVALFEADGGRWKHEAIIGIRDYLTGVLGTLTIVA